MYKIIDKDYVQNKKKLKVGDPMIVYRFGESPEACFYDRIGRNLNITNNGMSHAIPLSEIEDVDKLAIVKNK
jgi:hypothetical protein